MSYLTQEQSKNRPIAIGLVVLLHALLGWALISGLAVDVAKKVIEDLKTVNIEEEAPPPEEPPPPPPKLEEIPPYVPPPDVVVETPSAPPPTITTQTVMPSPPPAPPQPTFTPPAPQPPAPAPVPGTPATAIARTFEVSPDDYPDASRRAGEEGVTGVSVTIGTDGRVQGGSCQVVASSGFSRLDAKACQIAERRWRFKPATENGQPITTTVRRSYRWRLEEGR